MLHILAGTMTPYEYYNEYRNMTVSLVTGMKVFGVDVHEYKNAKGFWTTAGSSMGADFQVDHGMNNAWPKLWAAIKKNGAPQGTNKFSLFAGTYTPTAFSADIEGAPACAMYEMANRSELTPCFYGKGKPSAIRQVLRLAESFDLVDGTTAAMNTYCTDFIGIDCSGFVGNYLQECGSTAFGPETASTEFGPPAMRRKALDEVDALDVICWKDDNHVAIIDRIVSRRTVVNDNRLKGPSRASDMEDQGGMRGMRPGAFATEVVEVDCMVAESSAAKLVAGDIHTDGLNYTQYTIKSVDGKGVFRVQRGVGNTSTLWSVYISKLL